jgi:hypothetical protein
MPIWAPDRALPAYHAGVTMICELAARFPEELWSAPTPCLDWRASDLAGHLRCVADNYHEYLDDAPVSRMSRLMATGADTGSLARKLARRNAAELAALPDGSGPEHIRAFAASARSYAHRAVPLWQLPHHHYRSTLVTVGGMVGAACAEWHLHAWDLARTLGKDYRPADPDLLVAGWRAGLPQLPLDLPAASGPAQAEPAVVADRVAVGLTRATVAGGPGSGRDSVIAGAGGRAAVSAGDSPGWLALLRASGRLSGAWAPA